MLIVSFEMCGEDYNLNDILVDDYSKIQCLRILNDISEILNFPHFYEMKNIINIEISSNIKLPNKFAEFIYLRDVWFEQKQNGRSVKPKDVLINNNKMFVNIMTKDINIPDNIRYLTISLIESDSIYKLDNLSHELEYLQIRIDEENLVVSEENKYMMLRNLPQSLKRFNLILEGKKDEFEYVLSNIKIPYNCVYECYEYY